MKNFILLGILLFLAGSVLPADAKSMPAGAFFTSSVATTAELAGLISNDAKTAARLARHFGVSEAELASYCRQNLRIVALAKSRSCTMYFITKSGSVASKQVQLPAGERVFVSPDGTPVIAVRCGNPLAKRLPKVVAKVKQEVKPTAANPVATEALTAQLLTPSELEPIPVESSLLVAQAELAEPTYEAVLPSIAVLPALIAGSSSSWVLPAALGAAAVTSIDNGSRSAPVPEPGGLAALSTCGIGLAAAFLRRRSRS